MILLGRAQSLNPRAVPIRFHFACAALLLGGAQAACRYADQVAAPVLTLLPAAFVGGQHRDAEVCLRAGEKATAPVWVHEDTVTFTWRGRASQSATLTIDLGLQRVASEQLEADDGIERTYRTSAPRGDQGLTFALVAPTRGEVCLSQVALTQP